MLFINLYILFFIIIYVYNILSFTKLLYFLRYNIWYYYNVLTEAIFVVYIKKISGTYLQRISVFMQNFKFGGVTVLVLSVQLFNKIKRKKKKKMNKNLNKYMFLCISNMLCQNSFNFGTFVIIML